MKRFNPKTEYFIVIVITIASYNTNIESTLNMQPKPKSSATIYVLYPAK